jgi:hypothetical protein
MDHASLISIMNYDPDTGVFSWSKRRRGIKTNIPLGCDNGSGYLRITVLGTSHYAHRLAWFYTNKKWPEFEIDHINGVRNDNRIANLRDVPPSINQLNKHKAQSNSASKILGVCWHKKAMKWQAHICIFKKRHYLGLFDDINAAHDAYLLTKGKINDL